MLTLGLFISSKLAQANTNKLTPMSVKTPSPPYVRSLKKWVRSGFVLLFCLPVANASQIQAPLTPIAASKPSNLPPSDAKAADKKTSAKPIAANKPEWAELTAEQKTALGSFDKMNVIAFKVNDKNKDSYDAESAKVSQILKEEQYQELMKVGSGKDAASVSYVGDEDHIGEFVLFAKKKENGFAVVRILGKDMNPNNILTMLSVLKSSKIDMDQLKPLQELVQPDKKIKG